MIEQTSSNAHIEAEIAELSAQIEAKRRILESEQGIVEDRALVRQVVSDFVPPAQTTVSSAPPPSDNSSYLDNLSVEVREAVALLVAKVFERGLAKTITEARQMSALDLDAFHDTLTDKIYAELKNRGLVK